jgi:glyoxylase-like metal-dependent hydrolase (beta-lactamase superfamily II)
LFFAFRHGLRDKRSEPFTLIGPKGLDRLIDNLRSAYEPRTFDPRFPVEIRVVSPGERVEIGADTALSFAATPHTNESLALRIASGGRSICYTGDTAYSEQLAGFFAEADLLISECSFRERKNAAHLSVEDAARMAAAAGSARLLVTHFYFDVDDEQLTEELMRHYKGTVLIGRDGMVVEL